jgi:hypothetical protein
MIADRASDRATGADQRMTVAPALVWATVANADRAMGVDLQMTAVQVSAWVTGVPAMAAAMDPAAVMGLDPAMDLAQAMVQARAMVQVLAMIPAPIWVTAPTPATSNPLPVMAWRCMQRWTYTSTETTGVLFVFTAAARLPEGPVQLPCRLTHSTIRTTLLRSHTP